MDFRFLKCESDVICNSSWPLVSKALFFVKRYCQTLEYMFDIGILFLHFINSEKNIDFCCVSFAGVVVYAMISLLDHLLIIEGLTEFRSTEVVTFICGSGIPEPTITHLFHECLRIELFWPEPFPFLHLTFLYKLVEMQMVFSSSKVSIVENTNIA